MHTSVTRLYAMLTSVTLICIGLSHLQPFMLFHTLPYCCCFFSVRLTTKRVPSPSLAKERSPLLKLAMQKQIGFYVQQSQGTSFQSFGE